MSAYIAAMRFLLNLMGYGRCLSSIYVTQKSIPLSNLLEWLWNDAARPISDELGFRERSLSTTTSIWPHIWWILTGLMSRLPLYAAGRYYANFSETVLDRSVSLYSLTIKSLIYARQNAERKSLVDASHKVLLVSMRTTPWTSDLKLGDLRRAELEVDVLDRLLPPSTQRVKLRQPQKADVVGSLESQYSTLLDMAIHTPWIYLKAVYFSTTSRKTPCLSNTSSN